MHRHFATAWKLALALVCSIGLNADTVTMKNGDKVTGDIVKKDGASLTIKTIHFGTVTLPWAEVAQIVADKPINVVLPNKTVQGTLATAGDKVEVVAGAGKDVVTPAEITVLRNADEQKAYERLLNPALTDLWAGAATLGWTGTSGNARTQAFTVGMNAARATNTDLTKIYFNSIRASARLPGASVNSQTAQAVRGGWAYSRNISPRMFWNTFNDWEYDRFQSLDLRLVVGSGLGYNVWKAERGRFDLVGGLAWNHERFDPAPRPRFTRNSADAYWGNDFAYKLNSRASFVQSFRMFNPLNASDRWRMNFDAGLSTQLTKWLTWNATFSDRFLNSPAPGRRKNDVLYTTGFGFTFAR
jgi:putative salt-induced outer membrane protein YdiY